MFSEASIKQFQELNINKIITVIIEKAQLNRIENNPPLVMESNKMVACGLAAEG